MIRQFRRDPFYLAKYHFKSGIILLVANLFIAKYSNIDSRDFIVFLPAILLLVFPKIETVVLATLYSYGVSLWREDFVGSEFAYIPLAIIITMPFMMMIHNASHGSFKPRWLNRPVGELLGLIQLSGLPEWKITHIIHHSHSDDPAIDVHAPGDKTFWQFAFGMRDSVAIGFVKHFISIFGNNPKSMKALSRFSTFSKFNNLMKIMFWFFILGPQLFSFLFCTSIISKMLQFAWFNFATHRPVEGGYDIKNHDRGLYKLVNFFSIGLYYHKNHHLAPHLFDPRNYNLEQEQRSKDAA